MLGRAGGLNACTDLTFADPTFAKLTLLSWEPVLPAPRSPPVFPKTRGAVSSDRSRATHPGEVSADIRNIFPAAYIIGEYFWPGLTTSYRKDEAPIPFLQPRVMGWSLPRLGLRCGCYY